MSSVVIALWVQVTVRDLVARGRLRATLRPLIDTIPVVGAVKMSFVEAPTLSYQVCMHAGPCWEVTAAPPWGAVQLMLPVACLLCQLSGGWCTADLRGCPHFLADSGAWGRLAALVPHRVVADKHGERLGCCSGWWGCRSK